MKLKALLARLGIGLSSAAVAALFVASVVPQPAAAHGSIYFVTNYYRDASNTQLVGTSTFHCDGHFTFTGSKSSYFSRNFYSC